MQVMKNDALIVCLQGHHNNSSSVALWDIPSWQAMTRDWERPRTQHDIGEFLLFLYARWPAMHVLCQGRWEAQRQDINTVRILDSGGACPIFFMESLEAGNWNACSMMACIQQWHMPASLHALQSEAAAPEILCLQMNRFACRTGSYDKSRAKFHTDTIIGMPAFRQDLDVVYISYQLMACGVHLGTRPHNGHYRAALYDVRGTCWMCEDGVKACARAFAQPKGAAGRAPLQHVAISWQTPLPTSSPPCMLPRYWRTLCADVAWAQYIATSRAPVRAPGSTLASSPALWPLLWAWGAQATEGPQQSGRCGSTLLGHDFAPRPPGLLEGRAQTGHCGKMFERGRRPNREEPQPSVQVDLEGCHQDEGAGCSVGAQGLGWSFVESV